MNEIVRKAWMLLRRNPQLFLPTLVAGELYYVWEWLRLQWIYRCVPELLARIASSHSVLGGHVGPAPLSENWTFLLGGIATAGFRFLDVACMVFALVLTGRSVRRLVVAEAVDLEELPPSAFLGGTLRVTSLVFLLGCATAALVMIPSILAAMHFGYMRWLRSPWVAGAEMIPVYALLAYFVTPAALRLLATPDPGVIGPEATGEGRKAALAAGLVMAVLAALQLTGAKLFQGTPAQDQAFGVVGTALVELPYVPLFVVLELIVFQASQRPVTADATLVGELRIGKDGPVPEAGSAV